MNKRNKIYALLLAFLAVSGVVDLLEYRGTISNAPVYNLAFIIGIVILCRVWQKEDSVQLGQVQSRASKTLTVLIPPIGTTIYFFESRHWKSAIVATLLFWLGIIATAIVTANAIGTVYPYL